MRLQNVPTPNFFALLSRTAVVVPFYSADFGLDPICRACGECSDCVPCPDVSGGETLSPTVSDDETPSPTEDYAEETSGKLGEGLEDACNACFDLTPDQLDVLSKYDNGGKDIVCDQTCLDSDYDHTHCNCEYMNIARPLLAFGDAKKHASFSSVLVSERCAA